MNLRIRIRLLIALAIAMPGTASAMTLIDTGPGPGAGMMTLPLCFAGDTCAGVDGSQWLAGRFDLANPSVITDVRGWLTWNPIAGSTAPGETLLVNIHSTFDNRPGNILFSAEYFMTEVVFDWYGPSGLDWSLDAGTYWVSFGTSGAPPNFSMTMSTPVANPLDAYAFSFLGPNGWSPSGPTTSFGVQIEGSQVPLPGAFWLLFSAVAMSVRARVVSE